MKMMRPNRWLNRTARRRLLAMSALGKTECPLWVESGHTFHADFGYSIRSGLN
jgi:hypothetical protein